MSDYATCSKGFDASRLVMECRRSNIRRAGSIENGYVVPTFLDLPI